MTETAHRGRAIGVSDSGAAIMTVLAAVVTGPLVECTSLPAAGIAAASVALVPLLLLAHSHLTRRPSPPTRLRSEAVPEPERIFVPTVHFH